MAYHEGFVRRVREVIAVEDDVAETAMFGGLAFLVGGNIAVGISNTAELMMRARPGRDRRR